MAFETDAVQASTLRPQYHRFGEFVTQYSELVMSMDDSILNREDFKAHDVSQIMFSWIQTSMQSGVRPAFCLVGDKDLAEPYKRYAAYHEFPIHLRDADCPADVINVNQL